MGQGARVTSSHVKISQVTNLIVIITSMKKKIIGVFFNDFCMESTFLKLSQSPKAFLKRDQFSHLKKNYHPNPE